MQVMEDCVTQFALIYFWLDGVHARFCNMLGSVPILARRKVFGSPISLRKHWLKTNEGPLCKM